MAKPRHELDRAASPTPPVRPISAKQPFATKDTTVAAAVAVLLGVTLAMLLSAITTRFQGLFGNEGVSPPAMLGLCFLMLAVGIRLPQRVAMWACISGWRRFVRRDRTTDLSAVLLSFASADRPLFWIVLAATALLAGIATAVLPVLLAADSTAYTWLQAHFVWSTIPLFGLQGILIVVVAGIPLALLGQAISFSHRLSCPFGKWDTKATAYLLAGAAVGIWANEAIAQWSPQQNLSIVASALPVLIASVVAALLGSARTENRVETEKINQALLPQCSDRWPRLLRASLVSVAGSSACAISVWTQMAVERGASSAGFAGALLLATGAGVWMGCQNRPSRERTIGGFGLACVGAGTLIAGSAILVSLTSIAASFVTLLAATLGLAAIGFAKAYGRRTLLERVAVRTSTGATILSRMLVCTALILWVGVPVVTGFLGFQGTLIVLALSLVALGGTLVIHEPVPTARIRRSRMVMVFACMAIMILCARLTSVSIPSATSSSIKLPGTASLGGGHGPLSVDVDSGPPVNGR